MSSTSPPDLQGSARQPSGPAAVTSVRSGPAGVPAPTPGFDGVSLGLGLWMAAVLAVTWVLRPHDVGLVLGALCDRAVDLAIPLVLVGALLPLAEFVERRLFGTRGSLLDRTVLAVALLILWTQLLGWMGGLSRPLLAALSLMSALGGVRAWPGIAQDLTRAARLARAHGSHLAGALLAALLGLSLFFALVPATAQDALHYHLALPAHWLTVGRIEPVPGILYSWFPLNTELLFLQGLAWRGERAAQCFHWLLCLLTVLTVARIARAHTRARTAVLAATVLLAVPTALRVASWAYVEWAGLCFLTHAWARARGGVQGPGAALGVGLALGIACGTKYTLLLPASALGALCLWRARRAPAACTLAVLAGLGLGAGAWYLRNAVVLGNPMFPFLYGLFGGVGWDAERAALYGASLAEWGTRSLWLPFDVTFRATFGSVTRFDGVLGPTFLAALPLVVVAARRVPAVRDALWLALVTGIGWWCTTLQVRFLLPTLAFLAPLVAVGCGRLARPQARRWATGGLLAAVLVSACSPVLWLAQQQPLRAWIGLESATAYRDRVFPGGDAALFEAAHRLVPPPGRILLGACGNPPMFLLAAPAHADSVIENHTLAGLLAAGTPDAAWRAVRAAGFTHLLLRPELVFGPASDLEAGARSCLEGLLARYATVVLERGGTCLFALAEEAP